MANERHDIRSIRGLLSRLRWRERALSLVWILARCLLVLVPLFALCCALDWYIDTWIDTPIEVRYLFLLVHSIAWLAALALIIWALFRSLKDIRLALWIEEKIPELHHRLISAVEFAHPDADTRGMSPELILATMQQAEQEARRVDLSRVCPANRLLWALLVVLPLLLAVTALLWVIPGTIEALVARQFLAERELPHPVELTVLSPEVWPAREEGQLRFRVRANHDVTRYRGLALLKFSTGYLDPELLYEKTDDEGHIFVAQVPPADFDFTYQAWLGYGRLRRPGSVRYSPRPVVQSIQAAVLLPVAVVGKKATGQPYEEAQRGGDITYRLPGCQARITCTTQVPVTSARLVLHGDRPGIINISLTAPTTQFQAILPRLDGVAAYEIQVKDVNGFENREAPRRTIRPLSLTPPEVALLPETKYRPGDGGTPEDFEIEGVPVAEKGRFELAYRASAPYGLSHAQLRYRIIPRAKGPDADSGTVDLDRFARLPLGPVRDGKTPSTPKAREEFSTRPQATPESIPDTEGGGRYDFDIEGIPDGQGGKRELKEGDRIQFFVEVFSKADPEGKPGRSALREKEVVSPAQLRAWLLQKEDLKERTRYLEEQQRNARPGGAPQ